MEDSLDGLDDYYEDVSAVYERKPTVVQDMAQKF